MKLTSRKNAVKPNGPLRTFNEIASEFNLHPSVLSHIMGTSKVKPPSPFSHYKCATSEKTYYEMNAMRLWWAAYRKTKAGACPACKGEGPLCAVCGHPFSPVKEEA